MHARQTPSRLPPVRGAPSTRRSLRAIEACHACAEACITCADAASTTRPREARPLHPACRSTAPMPAPPPGSALARRTAANAALLRQMVETCADLCQACAAECDRHALEHEHCRLCAEACRTCETACREAATALGATGPLNDLSCAGGSSMFRLNVPRPLRHVVQLPPRTDQRKPSPRRPSSSCCSCWRPWRSASSSASSSAGGARRPTARNPRSTSRRAGMMGLLAFLLGVSLSMASDRYQQRRDSGPGRGQCHRHRLAARGAWRPAPRARRCSACCATIPRRASPWCVGSTDPRRGRPAEPAHQHAAERNLGASRAASPSARPRRSRACCCPR